MGVLLRIAYRNLVQARRRTTLLSLAVGLVTMLLVVLLSISRGIEDNLVKAATTVSAGHINVSGFFKPTPGSASPIVTNMTELRKVVEENTPGLAYVVDRHRGWGKIVSDTGSTQVGLSGLQITNEAAFLDTIRLAEEREYKDGGGTTVAGDARKLAEPHTIMLFANQAKQLNVGVGDVVTIQTETFGGQTNTLDATVVAIARDIGLLSSWSAFVPRADILELYGLNEDTTGALWVYLDDIDKADATMNHLREVLAAKGYPVMEHQPQPFFFKFEQVTAEDWTGQKIDLTTWRDEVSFLTYVLTAFNSLSWFLVSILVVIIAVGIMNTMWNAVRERTREIGTMRAIGMSQRRVLVMIMLEAVLLGVFATTTGASLGALGAWGVDLADVAVPVDAMKFILLSDTLHLSVKASAVAASIVVLSLFTALASLWPALRAASLRPITALQHVE
jgi:putative ABC transport system permease protein